MPIPKKAHFSRRSWTIHVALLIAMLSSLFPGFVPGSEIPTSSAHNLPSNMVSRSADQMTETPVSDVEIEPPLNSPGVSSETISGRAARATAAIPANLPFVYFVPFPEDQIKQSFDSIQTNGNEYVSVVYIIAGEDDTVIVYDHWEDGYEANISQPVQATTRVFGDGDPSNGDANSYCANSNCPGDIVGAGDVLVLEPFQTMTIPRNPGQIKFDGRDKFASSRRVANGRPFWSVDVGPLFAGAAQYFSADEFGRVFEMPIGQNLTSMSAEAFERVAAFVMPSENQTNCTWNGSPLGALNAGQGLRRPQVQTGDVLACDKPVQVHLITGDVGSKYESRTFSLFERETWSNSYFDPVASVPGPYQDALNYIYNPHNSVLSVRAETRFGATTISVPAQGAARYTKPDSAVHLYSADGRSFYALNANEAAGNSTQNQIYDWGHTLVPEGKLTTQVISGWAPGYDFADPGGRTGPNGSPVWVTPLEDTIIYADFDQDGVVDYTINPARRLYSYRIYDVTDDDQTGMRVYTTDGTLITAAWGEDRSTANPARPNIDVGTVTLPYAASLLLDKSVSLVNDVNGNGNYDPGDTARYKIVIKNPSSVPVTGSYLADVLPAGVTYVGGSATLDGVSVAPSAFPLGTLNLPDPAQGPGVLYANTQHVVQFDVTVNSGTEGQTLVNVATLTTDQGTVTDDATFSVPEAPDPPVCGVEIVTRFTDGVGADVNFVLEGSSLYVTVADVSRPHDDGVLESVQVTVFNLDGGDEESITLTETGASSNTFRNTSGLPVSEDTGVALQDGTLNGRPGHDLQVYYTNNLWGVTCSDTTIIAGPTQIKQLYLSEPGQSLDRVDPVATGDTTTASSEVLGGGSGSVQVDVTSSGATASGGASSLTFTHPATTSDADRLLLVGVAIGDNASSATGSIGSTEVTTVTYGGVALTKLGGHTETASGNTEARAELWYLVNPSSSGGSIVVTASGTEVIEAGATTFSGVDQANPLGAFQFAAGANQSTTATFTGISSAVGELVYSAIAWENYYIGTDTSTLTVGAGSTLLWARTVEDRVKGAGSWAPGAGSVDVTYTASVANSTNNAGYVIAATSIKPAPAGAASAVFTQTLPMASNFVMPAGGLITVTNYVSTTGTLTANPAITATLKSNGTTFATLTNPSATLIGGGTATIAVDATSSGTTGNGVASTLTIAHTTGAGANRLMLVGVGVANSSTVQENVSSVAYGGTPLTFVGKIMAPTGGGGGGGTFSRPQTEIWALANPASGTANVVITMTASRPVVAGVTTFTEVDVSNGLTSALGAYVSAASAASCGSSCGTTASVNATTAAGQVVFDAVGVSNIGSNPSSITQGAGQTQRWLQDANNSPTSPILYIRGGGSTKDAVGASTTMSWAQASTTWPWAIGAVPIKPASQPSVYRLDWSGVLASTTTVATGEAINLTVTSGISDPIQILYDSGTYPSKIHLPTNTVIKIDDLAFYDAPYPGGSQVTDATVGQTVFIRTTVSDPFGYADIITTTLNLDGTLIELNPTYVVSQAGAHNIYEYPWQTPPPTSQVCSNDYPIGVTANEGYENTISASASAKIRVTCDDNGAPCAANFLDVLGGNIVTQYTAGSTVFMQVVDYDHIGAGSVTVDLSGTSYTLAEVGSSTGVFQGADATIPGGASRTLTYSDPTADPVGSDVCVVDIAALPTTPDTPGISVRKTLVDPASGPAVVGDQVTFEIAVVNTGNVTLTVQLTDTFDAGKLQFDNASPTQSSTGAGSVSWSNIGPLAVGGSATVRVTFVALATTDGGFTTNIANATGTSASGATVNASDSDDVQIVGPSVSVSKTTTIPANRQALIGELVTFQVVVTNNGDSVLDVVPLIDNYDTYCLTFVSASQPPSSTGFGTLFWEDLTQTFPGNLGVGESFTLNMTFGTLQACPNAINTARVQGARDVSGNSLPVAEDDDYVQISQLYDFGDGPDSYGTLLASGGAQHAIGLFQPLHLGAAPPDAEADGQPGPSANGDDLNGTPPDDEDAFVALPPIVAAETSYNLTVPVSNTVGFTATLYGWVDFNLDGLFGPSEIVVVPVPYLATSVNLNWSGVDITSTIGITTYVRLRITTNVLTDTVATPVDERALGLASDGEVEDYAVVTAAGSRQITGQVRYDVDYDGDLADPDVGIANVTITLYTDPNGDGNPADGVQVAQTTTDVSGYYTFTNVSSPGTYVVQETDPNGFTSSADTDAPNDNRIRVVLTNQDSTGNDFLDFDTPDYAITKTVNTAGPVRTGDEISFTIRITNTSSFTITTLPLKDTYIEGILVFVSATPPPSSTSAGQIDWSDLTGSAPSGFNTDLAPGAAFELVVTFLGMTDTSALPGGVANNTATVENAVSDTDGPGGNEPLPLPTKSSTASIGITNPTAVALADAGVSYANNQILVRWQSANESNVIGYHIYRSVNGAPAQRLTDGMIAATKSGQSEGAVYEYTDASIAMGNLYRYTLEFIGEDGPLGQKSIGELAAGGRIFLPSVGR